MRSTTKLRVKALAKTSPRVKVLVRDRSTQTGMRTWRRRDTRTWNPDLLADLEPPEREEADGDPPSLQLGFYRRVREAVEED